MEAKIYWVDVQDVGKIEAAVRQRLKKAKKQLRKLASVCQNEEAACQVGWPVSVCFLVPCFEYAEGRQRGVEVLTRFKDVATAEGWATALHIAEVRTKDDLLRLDEEAARSGRSVVRNVAPPRNIDDGRACYPGVLLVARRERWQKSDGAAAS